MAQNKWAVRHTGRPFGGCERLDPEDYRYTISEHTTLRAARKRADSEYGRMSAMCGQGSWNDHFRVFPLSPVRMLGTADCPVCGHSRTIEYIWQPDTFDAWPRLQDSACEDCSRLSPAEQYTRAHALTERNDAMFA